MWMAAGLLFASVAFSQEDIDEPAGEVGDPKADGDYDYSDYGGEETETTESPKPESTEEKIPDNIIKDAGEAETWDSYSDMQAGSVMGEDVSDGVRVEDIVEPPSDYRYAAFGKPDPFVPPLLSRDNSVDSLEIPIVSPLQQYSLSELSLVGIWQMPDGERKAMVLTVAKNKFPSQGIIVKNGDPIANRGGKIIGIGEDYMTIREFSLTPDGTREFEDVQMFMGERQENAITGTITFAPGSPVPEVKVDQAGDPFEGQKVPDVAAVPGVNQPADNAAPENNNGIVPQNPAALEDNQVQQVQKVPENVQVENNGAPPVAPPAAQPAAANGVTEGNYEKL
jgi:Tfp pilus assembly protein PilP